MSRQPIEAPQPPVSMLAGYTTQQETSLTIYCHDKVFKRVTASLDRANGDKALFNIQSVLWGTSWSLRRKVYGRSLGNVSPESTGSYYLFDFRHHSIDLSNGWVVKADDNRRVLAILVYNDFTTN